MTALRSDPWRPENLASSSPRLSQRVGRILLCALLGGFGAVAAVWSHGANGRNGAWFLVVAAILWATAVLDERPRGGRVLLAVAGLGSALASVGYIGRLPAVVALLGVATASIAVGGWRQRASRAEPVVLAVATLVAAQVTWARSQHLATTALLLGVTLGVVALASAFPGLMAPPERLLRSAARRIGSAAGAVITFVVAVPLLYLPGAVAQLVGRFVDPRRRRPTTWSIVRTTPDQQRRSAKVPYAAIDPEDRRRQLGITATVLVVGISALLVITGLPTQIRDAGSRGLAAVASVAGRSDRNSVEGPIGGVAASDLPAIADAPWADAMAAEQVRFTTADLLVPDPVTGTRVVDFEGEYVTVNDGVRRTRPPPDCACESATVWWVGGSSAFGMGQRDEHTIASYLVQEAGEAGISLDVQNIAVPGWTLWQEFQGVLARLASGEQAPDMVVFFDGHNDVGGTLFSSAAGSLEPDEPAFLDPAEVQQFSALPVPSFGDETQIADLGRLAAARYQRVQRLIVEQLTALGIRSEFFFQPDAFATDVQRHVIGLIYGDRPELQAAIESSGAAFAAAAEDLEPEVHNLRGVFDAMAVPVFTDTVHTNESGARIQAEAIFDVVEPELAREAG